MSLYNKHRPKTFDEVVGQQSIVKSLQSQLKKKRADIPRSYLFYGKRGCGKTTFGRIYAKELGCPEHEIVELNIADIRGIDNIRDIRRNSQYTTLSGNNRVYIYDECQSMLAGTQDALLKLLEDSPKNVYHILCTTDPSKLKSTVKDRCLLYSFKSLKDGEVQRLLENTIDKENLDISNDVFNDILDNCEGIPRLVLTLLEKVSNITDEEVARELITKEVIESAEVIELCRLIVNKNWGWQSAVKILGNVTDEPEKIRIMITNYFVGCLKKAKGDDIKRFGKIVEYFDYPFADVNTGKAKLILALNKCYLEK